MKRICSQKMAQQEVTRYYIDKKNIMAHNNLWSKDFSVQNAAAETSTSREKILPVYLVI